MRLIVIAHNIRSVHNVGSIFRTSEGFGVNHLYLTGYTPYPHYPGDQRLPHITAKLQKQLHKTALGAERLVPFSHAENVQDVVRKLKIDGFSIVGLEQTSSSILLPAFHPPEKCALILGEEVAGIPEDLRALCNTFIEIPMCGTKESFNVSVAAGIALYALTNNAL